MKRIASLEMLDEVEELDLVLDHYVLSWAIKVRPGVDDEIFRRAVHWGLDPMSVTDNEVDEPKDREVTPVA